MISTSTECPNCHGAHGREVSLEPDASGAMRFVPRCPGCRMVFVDDEPTPQPPVARPSEPAPVAHQDLDILDLAKRRAAALRTEIAALRRAETELAMLERMIAAADPNTEH